MSPSRRRAIGAVRGFASCPPAAPRCRTHRLCPVADRHRGARLCSVRTARAPLPCAAWQVAHAESFAYRGLPAGAPRPRHGARQSRAPSAMLGPRASRLAPPLPTRITRAARFAAWHLAPPVAPKKAPAKKTLQKKKNCEILASLCTSFSPTIDLPDSLPLNGNGVDVVAQKPVIRTEHCL